MYVNDPTWWQCGRTVSGEMRVKNCLRMRCGMCAWENNQWGRIHENVTVLGRALGK